MLLRVVGVGLLLSACGTVDGASSHASATSELDASGPGGRRRGPPPEALEACTSLEAGAACSFTAPDGATINGTCRPGPSESDPLACAPERPPFGPPPEAFEACESLEAGAACSVTAPDGHTISGTCRPGPDGQGPLACAPEQGPGCKH